MGAVLAGLTRSFSSLLLRWLGVYTADTQSSWDMVLIASF